MMVMVLESPPPVKPQLSMMRYGGSTELWADLLVGGLLSGVSMSKYVNSHL